MSLPHRLRSNGASAPAIVETDESVLVRSEPPEAMLGRISVDEDEGESDVDKDAMLCGLMHASNGSSSSAPMAKPLVNKNWRGASAALAESLTVKAEGSLHTIPPVIHARYLRSPPRGHPQGTPATDHPMSMVHVLLGTRKVLVSPTPHQRCKEDVMLQPMAALEKMPRKSPQDAKADQAQRQ
eukprot:CAMPEP_0172672324 /NCGR_PEP_ID=MMETSP1074-20121228/11475_1 /TAXON_ID=2916 /ORGANISM="Ceratium fusus, Strain PA161109" /LENGTH=182 /DNA_ID=CAMNT_0013489495 /DNA_START=616 /DNA_END=1165 /DNA_ORIENTATION=-